MNSVLTSATETPVVRISGDVDIFSDGTLKQIERNVETTANVVFDVEDMRYVDTTFLRFLLRVRQQPNKGTRSSVRIVHATPQLRRVMEVTGLSRVFTLDERP
jgi:anti-anti-sigma factor